jgi:hypothetical protein
VVQLPHGFTSKEATEALKPLADKRVIEIDFLGNEGTFCGFGDAGEDQRFDRAVQQAGAYTRPLFSST